MPVTRMICALAERLKDENYRLIPVASLTVIGTSVLDRLEHQGVSTRLLRSAANDCVLAYLQLNQIERAEFDRAMRDIKRAGLMLGSHHGPGH